MENIEKIWRDFIAGKIQSKPDKVRDDVYAGWIRSKKLGIDPYMRDAPLGLEGLALLEELEKKKALLDVATPVIEDIYSVIKGSGSGVWLSNEKGIIIKCIADPEIGSVCEERKFKVGYDWSESQIGSNAIGTALYLQRPVYFIRAEHYRQISQVGYCSAAPIRDPEGNIIGVLDVTGFWDEYNAHTMGLVVAGALAIQREFKTKILNNELSRAHQYLATSIESVPSGVMIANADGILTWINNNACQILKVPAADLLNKPVYSFFDKDNDLQTLLQHNDCQEEKEYYSQKGNNRKHFTITWRPIKNQRGEVDGTVYILREIDLVRRLTNKMAGYRAGFTFSDIIGEDPKYRVVLKNAEIASCTDSNIMILGETGTGKEVLAQAIHNRSPRHEGPFVAVNCGALPRELIGSELFGYEEGAFTGAKRGGNPGKFELASHGTIFLDEIGDMPMDLQLVLLRVLQEKVVVRLGGQKELPIDVRIIAATNKPIETMISQGLFRADLYYRLSVVVLKIPPLRKRKGDIGVLAHYFLEANRKKTAHVIKEIDPETLGMLEQYNWPGNVRELENVIERAIIFSDGSSSLIVDNLLLNDKEIDLAIDFSNVKSLPNDLSLKSGEKSIIKKALHEANGNITKAAQTLGITRATMYRKIKEYNL